MEGKPGRYVEKFVGLAAGLILVIGILALIGAVIAFLNREYLPASLDLIATALSFGLFLVAVLGA